jgi:methylated-DNA-[protein]-cysteine S-methyltransferase
MRAATLCMTSRDKRAKRQADLQNVSAVAFATDLGWMALAHTSAVLRGIVFGHATKRQAIDSLWKYLDQSAATRLVVDFLAVEDQPDGIIDVVDRLTAYAAGEALDFDDVRVDERHLTDFGRKIQRACRRIPRGQTRSYGELAAICGSPGAARAVGQAMAKNRYPLVVPCHRVLASGGRIGGFSSPQGLTMKHRLLMLEDATLSAR